MIDWGVVAQGHGYITSGSSILKARCDADRENCRIVEVWAATCVVFHHTDRSPGKAPGPIFEQRIWSIGSAREDSGKRSDVRKTEDSSGLNCRLVNCRDARRGRRIIRVAEYVLQTG